jgi:hypothetical protein
MTRESPPLISPSRGDQDLDQRLTDDRATLAALAGAVAATGLLFRRGDVAAGRLCFGDLVAGIERVPAAARGALAIAGRAGPGSPKAQAVGSLVSDFGGLVTDLLAAQEHRDWVMLADLLEHELVPQLARWIGLFAALVPGGVP